MIGDGTFTPEQDAMLTALAKDDWLGFDYPAQAISAALSSKVGNWDPSQALLDSIEALQAEGTYKLRHFRRRRCVDRGGVVAAWRGDSRGE